ncbi:hypothetical protein L211DRAFT_836355, partial [Terfezia boudieri ATCC MYA-4762]
MNKLTRVRAPTTTTGTGAQGTYQIPSFALGGCERSGKASPILLFFRYLLRIMSLHL